MRYSQKNGWGNRPLAAYTAQHATEARDQVVNEWFPTIEGAEFPDWRRNVRGNGREAIEWLHGGRMIVFPPTASGLRGKAVDCVDHDEAFAAPDSRVEQSAGPTMLTRPSPQYVIQSTAGTNESAYWRAKVDDGRARAESGEDGRVYYLEYSAGPDDDMHDPAHWPRFSPALGYLFPLDALKIEYDKRTSDDDFYREFCNGWTGSVSQIISAAAWAKVYAPRTPRDGKVWMAVDAGPGLNGQGRSASIAVASYRGPDIYVEVVEHGAGLSWVADRIGELTRQTKVQELLVDTTGPIGSILSDIKARSMANVSVVDARTMASACGRFHEGVLDGSVHHGDQDVLNAAVAGAAKRTLEDQWAWKRRTSSADITPLVAVTLAHWAAALHPERGGLSLYVSKAA